METTRRPAGSLRAFTLIELLVVIAIIAILTAILLPVFAAVRENSRQSVSISNLKQIQQSMAQFKLDNHRYPDVLFGYAYPGSTMSNGLANAEKDDTANGTKNAALYFPGLYPAYIKDPEVFTDPNNPVDANATAANQVTGQLKTQIIAPCNPVSDGVLNGAGSSACTGASAGAVIDTTRAFYKRDAYDSSPEVTGGNQIDLNNFVVRYQLAREPTATVVPNGPPPDQDYKRQLRWQNPPADTLVTLTTYHVKNADKVLLLFESGTVKKMSGRDFNANYGGANFWKVQP